MLTRIVPVVVRSNNGSFEVRWVRNRAKGMRGMVCLLYSQTSRPHFSRRAGSTSTVAAAGDPVATVATDIQLLVVKSNLGSGEEEGVPKTPEPLRDVDRGLIVEATFHIQPRSSVRPPDVWKLPRCGPLQASYGPSS